MPDLAELAVVGGSGFYEFLEGAEEVKIDTPFGRHDIETVRGMGYRLRRASEGP